MPRYFLKFWGGHSEAFEDMKGVYVPPRIKGLRAVAEYICREYARQYAKGTVQRKLSEYSHKKQRTAEEYRRIVKNAEENYFITHIDAVEEALEKLLEKLKEERGID